MKWDDDHFKAFRPMVAISAVYQTIVMGYCLYSIKKGLISINPVVVSKDQFSRLCQVLIAINFVGLGFSALLHMPMFTYPESGWFYATCVVFCKFLGQMDFVASTAGETTALLS